MGSIEDYKGMTIGSLINSYENECKIRDECCRERSHWHQKYTTVWDELRAARTRITDLEAALRVVLSIVKGDT